MLYDSCPFLFNSCTKIIKNSRAGMTQAKINRQKSCLFKFRHPHTFSSSHIMPPFVTISPVHFHVTFRSLHSLPTILIVPPYTLQPINKKNLQHRLRHWRREVKKAATYSPTLHCSTIGASRLNFSVRNGKRWNPAAITT